MFPHLSAPKRVMLISSRKFTHAYLVNDSSMILEILILGGKRKDCFSPLMKRFGLIASTQELKVTDSLERKCSDGLLRDVFFLPCRPCSLWAVVLLISIFIGRVWATTGFLFLYNENCVQGSTGLIEKWDAFSSTQVSVVRHSGSLELQRRGTDPHVP